MAFLLILLLTTFSIAGSAAFFSVYGLAHIFSGSFWAVVFMGSSLEAGKLVSASYLYRYWDTTGWALRTYLMSAVLLLMVITSTGIFGYLSAAYQTDTLDYKKVETQLSSLVSEKEELTKRKTEIDKQISQLPPDYVSARQRLMKSFSSELDHINKRLPEITAQLQQASQQKIQVQAHTGPITYIASAFDATVDDATKWIVLMLIIVFDPLAVALTIATNKVVVEIKEEKKRAAAEKVVSIPTPVAPPAPIIESEPIKPVESLTDSTRLGEIIPKETLWNETPPAPISLSTVPLSDQQPPVVGNVTETEKPASFLNQEITPIIKRVEEKKPVQANPQSLEDKVQEIQEVLNELSNKPELTDQEKREQEALQELLDRRSVMTNMRQGKNPLI